MNIKEFINLVKKLPEDDVEAYVRHVIQQVWLRGYEKRNWTELRLKAVRDRMRKRYNQEIEILTEKYSRMGYFGAALEKKVFEEYLKDE